MSMSDRLAEIRADAEQAGRWRQRLEWLCDEVERVKAEASQHLAVMAGCVADEREATCAANLRAEVAEGAWNTANVRAEAAELAWTNVVETCALEKAEAVAENAALRSALSLAESVYRLNCVAPGEPSSVLDAMQAALATQSPAAAELLRQAADGKRAASLFEAIEHGDDDHRSWLREAIDNHLSGKPVPPPRGKGKSDIQAERAAAVVEAARGVDERGDNLLALHRALTAHDAEAKP